MNVAPLPAPLHLRPTSITPLSPSRASILLSNFLATDAPTVLANSGGAAVARANLMRLAEALREEAAAVAGDAKGEGKKRRKSEGGREGEGKRRKGENGVVAA